MKRFSKLLEVAGYLWLVVLSVVTSVWVVAWHRDQLWDPRRLTFVDRPAPVTATVEPIDIGKTVARMAMEQALNKTYTEFEQDSQ